MKTPIVRAASASLNLQSRNIYPWFDGPSPRRASREAMAFEDFEAVPFRVAGNRERSDLTKHIRGEEMATLNSRGSNGIAGATTALIVLALSLALTASAQTAPNQVVAGSSNQQNTSSAATNTPNNAPLTLTLQDALERAKKNNPEYRAALTEFGLAKQDRV